MIRLALMLLGTHDVWREWKRVLALGMVALILGAGIVIDASDGHMMFVVESFGWVLVLVGLFQAANTIRSTDHGRTLFNRLAAGVSIVAGLAIVDFPVQCDVAAPILFGVALMANGAFEMASAWVIRFPGWVGTLLTGFVTAIAGTLCFAEWREAERWAIPLFLGITLTVWGASSIHTAIKFRRLDRESSVLEPDLVALRRFLYHFVSPRYLTWIAGRISIESALQATRPSLAPELKISVRPEAPLAVHIWTPSGSMERPGDPPNQLLGRYIAAVDASGKVSSGHAALEVPPDTYISHYPEDEITVSASEPDVVRELRARDQRGVFQPDHATEVANWMPPNVTVRFHRFDELTLRRFWEFYRQDVTYNLTNRNCSVVVALALEVALAGALRTRRPIRTIARLMVDPEFWGAAFIRRKASEMVWTPGLVLDYAFALRNVLERHAEG